MQSKYKLMVSNDFGDTFKSQGAFDSDDDRDRAEMWKAWDVITDTIRICLDVSEDKPAPRCAKIVDGLGETRVSYLCPPTKAKQEV